MGSLFSDHPRRRPRALVTGAAGFIGSHLVDAMLDEGYEVTGVDALLDVPYAAATKRTTVSVLAARSAFRLVTADLRHAPLDDLVAGVDVVIHAAALAGLVHTSADPGAAWEHNAGVTQRLVAAARGAGVHRFVHVSTSSVYGATAVGDERQAQRPISVYGHSKRAAEHAVTRIAAEGGLDTVIVRYFSVYGPRQRADMAYHRFIEALLCGRPLTVHGDGSQRRSITYVADAVAGTLAALRHGQPGEAYNVGGDQSTSVLEAIRLLAVTIDIEPRLHFVAGPPGDQRHTSADTSKARRELGWTAGIPPSDGLARQVAWHRLAAQGRFPTGLVRIRRGNRAHW